MKDASTAQLIARDQRSRGRHQALLGAGPRTRRNPGPGSAGLSAALALPFGIALAEVLDDDPVTIPPLWQLLVVVLGSVLVITATTAIAGRVGGRRRVAEVLQAELA